MDEGEVQTKTVLIAEYIFSSIMTIAFIFIISASMILYKLEIAVSVLPFTQVAGFTAFMLLMFIFLMNNLRLLVDAACKLNDGEYY